MKRLLLSFALLIGASGLIFSATRAYLTDTAVLGDVRTLSTGSFTVSVNGSTEEVSEETFTWTLPDMVLEPGEETPDFTVEIVNDGNIDLGWVAYFTLTGDAALGDAIYIKEAKTEFLVPNGNWEPTGTDQFILNGTGNVSGLNGHSWNSYYQTLANNSTPFQVVSLNSWNNANAMGAGGGVQMGSLLANDDFKYRFTFKLAMHPDADNTYMGKSLDLSYTVHATQVDSGALDALFSSQPRLSGPGSNHTSWMNAQIAKQEATLP